MNTHASTPDPGMQTHHLLCELSDTPAVAALSPWTALHNQCAHALRASGNTPSGMDYSTVPF
ncbi:Uncharacterised protein [Mycobacteroides abscessus subsp. abscessus]|uniref:hypothetical protein n=1 Tax=Mycobacteroides abscessus TaxID=36809 RepID=UPI0009278492|nr:hypothetical protein [Mycobacteroides abscessus]SIE28416.1 Uncharacterised protein [Mycobacteroides abscessus subsp. abscessus]SKV14575.1 Uncharacterised protein [Mycobacteroides abscessus subsp. abscessus]